MYLPEGSKRATVMKDLRQSRWAVPRSQNGRTYLVRVDCPCSSSLSSISSTNSIRERSVFLKSQRYASPVESNARTIWLVGTEVSLKKHIGQSGTTYLFLGWNDAEITGASKRIVQCRCGGSQAEARSQTSTFQSLDEVKTYREFRDQLRQKNQLPKHKPSEQGYVLDTSYSSDMSI